MLDNDPRVGFFSLPLTPMIDPYKFCVLSVLMLSVGFVLWLLFFPDIFMMSSDFRKLSEPNQTYLKCIYN